MTESETLSLTQTFRLVLLLQTMGARALGLLTKMASLTSVANTDTTSGTTAAMVVTNSAGNTHGIVVQEEKTVVSGGTSSSSLTLADNGATFSNSATGRPIQVHGVADGTADFDATNVRQVYSGLAAVLAATPELRLEPGKTGAGIGLGSYGGFHAVGFGLGHMYDNGAVFDGVCW